MKKLKCTNKKVTELAACDIEAMHLLFSKYYHNANFSQFKEDLMQKDYVFVLRDKSSLEIKGFSTIVELSSQVNQKSVRGFFSGDTVIDREYWGQGTLGVAFLGFLFIQKLKRPFTPLYWFLISKGYKTYLLMANNFKTHYPRFEQKTPKVMQGLIDTFAMQLYGEHYDSKKGVITYSQHETKLKDCLKSHVTPITEDMKIKNKRIEFFAHNNPQWEKGDELACLAKMTLSMPFYYQYKILKKQFFKFKRKLPSKLRRAESL
ncbi:MAG: hypothetical protein CME65_04910 [Halobacteriovoraceae bacterium]|nr:hypothetical protein [Halobacteriovoraceae bacterium]|tara:strand:- start:10053 stop:10838 length:786 start_codon:yes stop_codon:yes gene_type:complete